jgi:hypothetical protein
MKNIKTIKKAAISWQLFPYIKKQIKTNLTKIYSILTIINVCVRLKKNII